MVKEISYDPTHDAQLHFRVIMDAMARPGKINQFSHNTIHPPEKLNTASALIGFALLNRDVGFHCKELSEEVETYLRINTDAPLVALNDADFIFLEGNSSRVADSLQHVKTGNIKYPEQSATLIIQVAELSSTEIGESPVLILRGPGIASEQFVHVSHLHSSIVEILKILNDAYPLGVDVFITDSQGKFIGIPRTTQMQFKA